MEPKGLLAEVFRILFCLCHCVILSYCIVVGIIASVLVGFAFSSVHTFYFIFIIKIKFDFGATH